MAPPHLPSGGTRPPNAPMCRYPGCTARAFFDSRVGELREWCSNEHMMYAVRQNVEQPCRSCRVWPRRNGYRFCSGDVCRFSYKR